MDQWKRVEHRCHFRTSRRGQLHEQRQSAMGTQEEKKGISPGDQGAFLEEGDSPLILEVAVY